MRERITVRLSESSLDAAIKRVNELKRAERTRLDNACKAAAEKLMQRAQEYFNGAWYDDVGRGERREADVDVTVEKTENGYKVVARGESVVWVEFGAGIYHNGAVGQSPHPRGNELGFTIGGYGKGHGKQTSWGYYNADGELVITKGTEAQMPLYRAFLELLKSGEIK